MHHPFKPKECLPCSIWLETTPSTPVDVFYKIEERVFLQEQDSENDQETPTDIWFRTPSVHSSSSGDTEEFQEFVKFQFDKVLVELVSDFAFASDANNRVNADNNQENYQLKDVAKGKEVEKCKIPQISEREEYILPVSRNISSYEYNKSKDEILTQSCVCPDDINTYECTEDFLNDDSGVSSGSLHLDIHDRKEDLKILRMMEEGDSAGSSDKQKDQRVTNRENVDCHTNRITEASIFSAEISPELSTEDSVNIRPNLVTSDIKHSDTEVNKNHPPSPVTHEERGQSTEIREMVPGIHQTNTKVILVRIDREGSSDSDSFQTAEKSTCSDSSSSGSGNFSSRRKKQKRRKIKKLRKLKVRYMKEFSVESSQERWLTNFENISATNEPQVNVDVNSTTYWNCSLI